MLGIGMGEILFLCVIVLLVYGPEKLPKFARKLGKFTNDAKRAVDEIRTAVKQGKDDAGDG